MSFVQTQSSPSSHLADAYLDGANKSTVATMTSDAKAARAHHAKQLSTSTTRQQQRGMSTDDVEFYRWRPTSHLLSPHGWMNDPCGPVYDPKTGFYHLWYEWNPKGSTWGNMSWGHAKSRDLVHWQSSREAVIEPGTEYDHKGIFTGCVLMRSPTQTNGQQGQGDEMTVIYTAASHLPIHHSLPYNRGSEKLALSTSSDGGQTWTPQGCILDGPPSEADVVSWRDPYVGGWPLLDEHLNKSSPGLYGIIAGGLRDRTPTIFAYSIDPHDLASWEYLGHLCDVGRDRRSSPHGINLGKNWEVCNFFSVSAPPVAAGTVCPRDDYLLINVEGCNAPGPHRGAIYMRLEAQRKALAGSQLGFSLEPSRTGRLDHGCLYAANSFQDPVRDRRIMWGWITEDDLPEDQYNRQGWSGCLSLPRELFCHPASDELGIRPAEEVMRLRQGARHSQYSWPQAGTRTTFELDDGAKAEASALPGVSGRSLEMCAVVSATATTADAGAAGVVLAHSADLSTRTLVYVTSDHRVVVDRIRSAGKVEVVQRGVDVKTERIDVAIPARRDGQPASHRLRVFLDNSVLEVFVDDVVAISTRIYPDDDDIGVSLFGQGPEARMQVDVWQGLAPAHVGWFA
ncbi:putative beta-Fructufuranosidase [Thecaphora frezii]